ncbi:MAG TPA: tetratricopeptide repeat protein [Chthonomonadaceae bacterium]|nr:tetratricopeptide repeat protein [Chthonomonadaceae bacterium]
MRNSRQTATTQDPAALLAQAQGLTDRASERWNTGDYPAAEPLCRRALDLTRTAVGADDPRVAERLYNLAALYHFQRRFREALPLFQQAIRIHEAHSSPDGAALAFCCAWLARTRFDAWREDPGIDGPARTASLAEAEADYLRALNLMRGAALDDTPEYAAALMQLAHLYDFRDRYAEAADLLGEAQRRREELFGAGHMETAETVGRLALIALHDPSSRVDPDPLLRRALAIRREQLDPGDPGLWEWIYRLADLCAATGRGVEARRLFSELERALRASGSDPAPEYDWIVAGLVDHLIESGRPEPAESLEAQWFAEPVGLRTQRRELARQEVMLGPEHPLLIGTLCRLAEELRFDERPDEAVEHYTRALEIAEGDPDAPPQARLPILNGLAMTLRALSAWNEAAELLEQACEVALDGAEETLLQHARAVEQLGWVRYAADGPTAAEPLLLRACSLVESAPTPSLREVAELRYRLSIFLSQEARFAEAEQSVVAAIEAAERSGDVDPLEIADYREQYAAILNGLGLRLQADVQLSEVRRAWRESGAPRDDL